MTSCRTALLLLVFVVSACSSSSTKGPPTTAAAPPPDLAPAAAAASGLDVAGMDRAVAPGDDFFAYANGGWLKTHDIPADRSGYGAGAVLVELTAKRVADLVQQAATGEAPPGLGRAQGRRHLRLLPGRSGHRAEGARAAPPRARRASQPSPTRSGARAALGTTLRADVDVLNNTILHTDNLFGLWVAQDLDDPTRYAPFLLAGRARMPDRDYYLDPSPRMADVRAKYEAHVAAMLTARGRRPTPRRRRSASSSSRRRIAAVHASRGRLGGREEGRQPLGAARLRQARAPGLDWDAFFAAAGLDGQARSSSGSRRRVAGIAALVQRAARRRGRTT